MITVPLAKVGFFMGVIGVLWVFVAIALILIILVQKGKGGGLSAAFGGAGGAGGLLGTKTGDFLTWVTISLVATFLLLSVVMVKWFRPTGATGLEATPTKQAQDHTRGRNGWAGCGTGGNGCRKGR